ncbi:carbohydrate porin [Aeromonas allosaccharophila]|uniref:carbohydrate porin n=1 Tax=Aeromonas allosaccharophila TaxID=656 RepID=UPI0034235063
MTNKSVIATAVASVLFAGCAFAQDAAKGTDVLKDGWEVHGYGSMNVRNIDGETVDTEFGKPDYKTAGTHGKSTNQVEFSLKKHTEHQNGAWSDFVLRSEYGNGNSYAYSSDGSQKKNDEAQFEVKEAFVEIGGLSFLGDDTSVWGGQRYLNRAAGLLSGEYWKQSSGVGTGVQTKIAGNTTGVAMVMADPDAGKQPGDRSPERETLTSYDFYYYGVDVGFGKLDFDFKYMKQANKDSNNEDGFGAGVTLNTNYYGLDGWAQSAVAYGKGVAQNRGLNFGSWSGGNDKAESIFATTYGVWNISDRWQMGSEVTYFGALDELFGAEDLSRFLVAVRPSYKINDNLRVEMTGSYGQEKGADNVNGTNKGYWGRTGDAIKGEYYNVELALPITVNADYFGRPQIKPYVSYIAADDAASASTIGIKDGKDETVVGVHTEIWF